MANIVIMGAGIGGMPAAYEMRELLPKEHTVTVVSAMDFFQFVPSNPWLAVGWRKREEIVLKIAPLLERKGIQFIAKPVTTLDAAGNKLVLSGGTADEQVLPYDYLVITTGPKLSFDEVPGAGPHGGHTHSVCSVDHAESFWKDYQEFLKNPGPVVIGAMPMASCFGPAYEFAFILDTDLRRRKLRDRVPITYVTSEPYVGHMGLGGVGDSKGLLESEFRKRHIKWIANARIARATPDAIEAQELDDGGQVVREHALPCRYAMVMPPFTGVDAVRAAPELCNPRGFVLIDAHQRSPKFANVFAAGVCVAIPPVEATPVPTGAPKTGFMIESMVSAVVANVCAAIDGRDATARATWNAICLADMGDTGMAFVALPQIPPRNVTWTRAGRWVHVAKVAFEKYFLAKMRSGNTDPVYERYVLKALGIERLKQPPTATRSVS